MYDARYSMYRGVYACNRKYRVSIGGWKKSVNVSVARDRTMERHSARRWDSHSSLLFFIPLSPCSFLHLFTFPSISHLTKTITKLITQLSNVSSSPQPFRRLPPSTPHISNLHMKVVGTISSPLSKPLILLLATSSAVWPASPSSNFFVKSDFTRFSAS